MINKNEIINHIATSNTLHNLIVNIGGTNDEDLKDLEQDIYLDLYTKSDKVLNDLYNNGQLSFYLARMVCNNIHSSTSRYYTTYKKPRLITDRLEPENDEDE